MNEKDISYKINAVMTNKKAKEAFDTLVAVKDSGMKPVEIIELVYRAIFENDERR